ncbi:MULTISPECIES: hypothetical protein [Chitinophagaceae]
MKKIVYLALSFSLLTAVACNSNDTTSQKLDFTQSYENAALALTSAQDNYNTALASKDTTKISQARKELETATTNYVNSKNSLVQHGGTAKAEYETNLSKSEQVLSHAAALAAPSAATNTKDSSIIGGKVGQALSDGSKKIENAKSSATNTINKANQTVQDTKTNIQKNAQDAQDKAKKLKDDVNNLFKK